MTDLALVISHESTIPIYLQIKNQLWFLILSRRLGQGTRLPSVRELAEQLAVNPGTVAQAYRELKSERAIVTRKGTGTFVESVEGMVRSDPHEDAALREELLARALDRAIGTGRSLGFTAGEVQQRAMTVLSGPIPSPTVAFVGPTDAIASKYATLLSEAFPDLEVRPLLVDDLRDSGTPEKLGDAYYVATLASIRHEVQERLSALGERRRAVGMVMRLDAETHRRLADVPKDRTACLVAERRNLHAALNLLTSPSVFGAALPHALTEEPESVAAMCRDRELVIHTLSARGVLDGLGVRPDRRVELRFELDPDSLEGLGSLVGLVPERGSGELDLAS